MIVYFYNDTNIDKKNTFKWVRIYTWFWLFFRRNYVHILYENTPGKNFYFKMDYN